MAKYAVIENEIVTNVIVSDSLNFANLVVQETNPTAFCVLLSEKPVIVGYEILFAGIGWGYIDGEFIPPVTPDIVQE